MSRRDWRERIEDILDAIGNLRRYAEGITFEQFASNVKTLHAATYEITVIGEAARHIPDEVKERHPAIPWHRMQAIRNVVVHEYFRIDAGILWHAIHHDLPPLVPELRRIVEGQP